MVKKIDIEKLEKGMRICGLEKDGDDTIITFVNKMLIRGKNDVEALHSCGYKAAYIIVAQAQMRLSPLMPTYKS